VSFRAVEVLGVSNATFGLPLKTYITLLSTVASHILASKTSPADGAERTVIWQAVGLPSLLLAAPARARPMSGQTRTSSLGAARPFPPSAAIGPGGQSVG